jgi:hypothetical protein
MLRIERTTQSLDQVKQQKLKKEIARIHRRFPQLGLPLVVHQFPNEHPLSMHGTRSGFSMQRALRATVGGETITTQSSLRSTPHAAKLHASSVKVLSHLFMKPETLDHLLKLGDTDWQNAKWAEGLLHVIDGLDSLLKSIAIPDETRRNQTGDF